MSASTLIVCAILALFMSVISCGRSEDQATPGPPGGMNLWYQQPAATWTEALPVGNGRLAAIVFGGVDEEHLQLNEGSSGQRQPGGTFAARGSNAAGSGRRGESGAICTRSFLSSIRSAYQGHT